MYNRLMTHHTVLDSRTANRLLNESDLQTAEQQLANALGLENYRQRALHEWLVSYYFGVVTEIAGAKCCRHLPVAQVKQFQQTAPLGDTQVCVILAVAAHAYCYHTGAPGPTGVDFESIPRRYSSTESEQTNKLGTPNDVLNFLSTYPSSTKTLVETSRLKALTKYLSEIFDSEFVQALLHYQPKPEVLQYRLDVAITTPHVQRSTETPAENSKTGMKPTDSETLMAPNNTAKQHKSSARAKHAHAPPVPEPTAIIAATTNTGLYKTTPALPQTHWHALYHDLPIPETKQPHQGPNTAGYKRGRGRHPHH